MAAKRKLRKVVDDRLAVRCSVGRGLIREEAWEDERGVIVRYNLAFINKWMTARDRGRVLGYDNAHGKHHRHFFGVVETISVTSYEGLAATFYAEVEKLK